MKHDIVIRDATSGDAEVIAEFNSRLAIETENKQLDANVLLSGVKRALERPEMCRYFMAEIDGRVVGQSMVTYEWTDWRDGVIWWFQSVYVLKSQRGCGVFRAIYRHVVEAAQASSDVRGLRLYVDQRNRPAMETYRRLGMHDAGYYVYEDDWSEAVRPVESRVPD